MKLLKQVVKNVRKAWNRNWSATILLLLFLGCGLTTASKILYDLAMKEGFQILRAATLELGGDIRAHVLRGHVLLRGIAQIIGGFPAVDSPETQRILSSFGPSCMISRLEILFPGDRLLSNNGKWFDVKGRLSFLENARPEIHISDLAEDIDGSGKLVLRTYVPIWKDGNIEALLIGVTDVEKLPQQYNTWAFGRQSYIYLVEGKSGKFLVDTWHKTLSSMEALGSRKTKPGYSYEKVRTDFMEGRSGNIAFLSRTTGEYLYAHYEPVGVNHWVVILSAPESVVFRSAEQVRLIFYILTAFVFVVCAAYFAWMLAKARKQTKEKEMLLRQVRSMFAVEKTLFDAHRISARLGEALMKVADMMDAEWAFFIIFAWERGGIPRVWTDQGAVKGTEENGSGPEGLCPKLYEALRQKGHILLMRSGRGAADDRLSADVLEECSRLCRRDAGTIMATPVESAEGFPIGVLGVANMRSVYENADCLKNVALSFSMAFHNMKFHQKIREMGMIDYLTGLLNRNSFQSNVPEYARLQSVPLACIYIDANGLHELNNSAGHAEGDRMLRYIAGTLKREFGEEHTYRIGGDEFVVFVLNEAEEEIRRRLERVERDIEAKGYHVSCGMGWSAGETPVQKLISEAEQRMYDAKSRYYQQTGNDRRGAR